MRAGRRSGLGRGIVASALLHAAAVAWLHERAIASGAPPAPVSAIRVRVLAAPAPAAEPEAAPLPLPERPAGEAAAVSTPTPEPVERAAVETSARAPARARDEPAAQPSEPDEAQRAPRRETLAALPLPAVSAGPSPADALERYKLVLLQRIAAHKRYPALARRRGIEGPVRLRLRIDERGGLAALETPGRSPRVLADEARRAVERAAPFAPPPGGSYRIEFSMNFDLDD